MSLAIICDAVLLACDTFLITGDHLRIAIAREVEKSEKNPNKSILCCFPRALGGWGFVKEAFSPGSKKFPPPTLHFLNIQGVPIQNFENPHGNAHPKGARPAFPLKNEQFSFVLRFLYFFLLFLSTPFPTILQDFVLQLVFYRQLHCFF